MRTKSPKPPKPPNLLTESDCRKATIMFSLIAVMYLVILIQKKEIGFDALGKILQSTFGFLMSYSYHLKRQRVRRQGPFEDICPNKWGKRPDTVPGLVAIVVWLAAGVLTAYMYRFFGLPIPLLVLLVVCNVLLWMGAIFGLAYSMQITERYNESFQQAVHPETLHDMEATIPGAAVSTNRPADASPRHWWTDSGTRAEITEAQEQRLGR